MKWNLNEKPTIGDVRFVTKFAWLPTEVRSKINGKLYIIWFQMYIAEQVYTFDKSLFTGIDYMWLTINRTIHI